MVDSCKRNDLTDSNYNFMKDVSGQTETKVTHKPAGNEQYYSAVSPATGSPIGVVIF